MGPEAPTGKPRSEWVVDVEDGPDGPRVFAMEWLTWERDTHSVSRIGRIVTFDSSPSEVPN